MQYPGLNLALAESFSLQEKFTCFYKLYWLNIYLHLGHWSFPNKIIPFWGQIIEGGQMSPFYFGDIN